MDEKEKLLTSQEAFNKYGPNDDRFYTSQGLDPKEQKEIINKLNSGRKPKLSDKEVLNQLHKESEESANKFLEISKETKKNKLITKKIKKTPNELTKELTKSKNLLNNKKELAIIAGAIVAGAVIGGSMLFSKDKKKKKQHKTGLYESFDYNDYDKDTKNTKKVSSFSRGHSTYSLR